MLFLFIDLMIGVVLLAIALIDARTFVIPDRLSFTVIGLALLRIPFADSETMIDLFLGGLLAFILFETTRRIMAYRLKRDALGMGDVKLMIGGGLWLGLSSLPTAILIACFGGMIQFGILSYFYKMPIRDRKIPFGPYLVMGLLIAKLPFIQNFASVIVPL